MRARGGEGVCPLTVSARAAAQARAREGAWRRARTFSDFSTMTGMRSGYFSRMRCASAWRFCRGCSCLNAISTARPPAPLLPFCPPARLLAPAQKERAPANGAPRSPTAPPGLAAAAAAPGSRDRAGEVRVLERARGEAGGVVGLRVPGSPSCDPRSVARACGRVRSLLAPRARCGARARARASEAPFPPKTRCGKSPRDGKRAPARRGLSPGTKIYYIMVGNQRPPCAVNVRHPRAKSIRF